jgi:hypothetical protein
MRVSSSLAVLRRKSCRESFKAVLVMETREDRLRSNEMPLWNVVTSQLCQGQGWRLGHPRAEASVRATLIVMTYPLGQDLPQMPFIQRNEVVETFVDKPALPTSPPIREQSRGTRIRSRTAR